MSFWFPILAAAVCAYLGDRLARMVRPPTQGDRNEPQTR